MRIFTVIRQGQSRSLEEEQDKSSASQTRQLIKDQSEGPKEEDRSLGDRGSALQLNAKEFESFGGKTGQLATTWWPTSQETSSPPADTEPSTTSPTPQPIVYDDYGVLYPGVPLGILNERQVDNKVAVPVASPPNVEDTPTTVPATGATPSWDERKTVPPLLPQQEVNETPASTAGPLVSQTESFSTESTSAGLLTDAVEKTTAATADAEAGGTSTPAAKRLQFRGQPFRLSLASSTTSLPLLETEATRRTSFVPTSATEGRRETTSSPRYTILKGTVGRYHEILASNLFI